MIVQDYPSLRQVMKQSAQMLLLALLLYMLLFLAIFNYFTESRVDQSHRPIFRTASDLQRTVYHRVRQSESRKAHLSYLAERRGLRMSRRVFRHPLTRDESSNGDYVWRGNRKYMINKGNFSNQYYSKRRSVISSLWKGELSSKMLSGHLQRSMKDYVRINKHKVLYTGQRKTNSTGQEVLCQMKQEAQLRTLNGSEQPFTRLGFKKLVPPQPMEQLSGVPYKRCAVVTSAGAILNSLLGKEIDSHDAVLRFNAAPSKGYERDAGSKTTIRIMNSQILANPKYRFSTSPMYKNITLVAWDPAPYSIDLQKWYQHPDYDLFAPYMSRRKKFPEQPFYILHPSFIWKLWDIVQSNTQENIQPNPPSSGFIGIVLMMNLCEEVNVYEYIPSTRQTDLCHYHETYYDAACTFGAYHPLLFEKLLVQRMNTAAVDDLKKKGKVTLAGFHKITCPS